MNDVSVIVLTGKRGGFTVVDNEDFAHLNQWRWQLTKKGYVRRCEKRNSRVRAFYLHREILGLRERAQGDHKNRVRHDNRRYNLRPCAPSQNSANAVAHFDGSSPFKGVSFHKKAGKWMAAICGQGKRQYLGLFADPKQAAEAYNNAARLQWGEFARLNVL